MALPHKTHRTITPREAAAARSRGELVIVDVREPAERDADRIARTLHIPLAQVPRRLEELSRLSRVAFVCRSGRRGAAAAAIAARAGVDASNVRGGMRAWRAARLPVATETGAPTPDPKEAA